MKEINKKSTIFAVQKSRIAIKIVCVIKNKGKVNRPIREDRPVF